jgi:serine/threonine protein phosphatase PrpC
VGEPRLWLQDAGGPGLLLSRSLGDLTAATVGCTSDPEVTFSTLRAHVDHVLVLASDGVWDVLTNEQVRRPVRARRGGCRVCAGPPQAVCARPRTAARACGLC